MATVPKLFLIVEFEKLETVIQAKNYEPRYLYHSTIIVVSV